MTYIRDLRNLDPIDYYRKVENNVITNMILEKEKDYLMKKTFQ